LFDAAVAAAQPAVCLPAFIPPPPRFGKTVVIGAGKAAGEMARVLDLHWPDSHPLSGIVAAKYGGAKNKQKEEKKCRRIQIVESAHPVPDKNSVIAARLMLDAVRGLSSRDLVIALISGGGSALAAYPASGISLADKQNITKQLLASGAAIGEINIVRGALSQIKNGRLARAAYPARVVTLAISDVPGDAPADIASAPTILHPQKSAACAPDIIRKYRLSLPPAAKAAIRRAIADDKKGEGKRIRGEFHIIASAMRSLRAAAAAAQAAAYAPLILSDRIEGEAREAAKTQAAIALSALAGGGFASPPTAILSGGETTVSFLSAAAYDAPREGFSSAKKPSGGRNTEFALSFALAVAKADIAESRRISAIAADTDGEDGLAVADNGKPAAGAIVHHQTIARARAAGINPEQALIARDSAAVFNAAGGLVVCGATATNVNDFRAALIDPPRR
jgi:hydroxypyruvate reductase